MWYNLIYKNKNKLEDLTSCFIYQHSFSRDAERAATKPLFVSVSFFDYTVYIQIIFLINLNELRKQRRRLHIIFFCATVPYYHLQKRKEKENVYPKRKIICFARMYSFLRENKKRRRERRREREREIMLCMHIWSL